MAKIAKYGISSGADIEEIRKELRRAGKAANQRLRRLEQTRLSGKRSGFGEAYLYAKSVKKVPVPRFAERPGKMGKREMLKELGTILAFLNMLSSTETGRKYLDDRKYHAYVDKGFKGTFEEFKEYVEQMFQTTKERQYSSSIAYTMLTSDLDAEQQKAEMDAWLRDHREQQTEGQALIKMLRERKKRR